MPCVGCGLTNQGTYEGTWLGAPLSLARLRMVKKASDQGILVVSEGRHKPSAHAAASKQHSWQRPDLRRRERRTNPNEPGLIAERPSRS